MSDVSPAQIISLAFTQYRSELLAEINRAQTLLAMRRISDAGKVLEIALSAQLARILPEWIGMTRGIIVSSDCTEQSKEIDLILYDKRYFPGLIVSQDGSDTLSYISIDVVLGVISIKKTLRKSDLREAITNIKSVTALNRKPLFNQLHFDMALNANMTFREGQEVNRFFSCIVGYENDLFYRTENKERRLRTDDEVTKYFDDISNESWFDELPIDLIYTVDGTLFFPLVPGENGWTRTVGVTQLSEPKMSFRPHVVDNRVTTDSKIALAYCYDFDNAEKALGQFIMYLQFYCSQLVKSSPDFEIWFAQFVDADIKAMMTTRDLSSVSDSKGM